MQMKAPSVLAILCLSLLFAGCTGPFEWWGNVNRKAHELNTLRTRHDVLEAEFKALKAKHLELEHRYGVIEAELAMLRGRKENLEVAGDEKGRHLANIDREVSKSLSMKERHDLALEHLERGKFEDAYALFESFLWVPEGAPFQSVGAFYGAGVAAFQIRNFNRAREYFEAVNAHGESLRDHDTIRRARLWLKVLDRKGERKVASH